MRSETEDSSGKQKTIFLATPYGVNVRDILRSSVFKEMRASNHRIVIFSPAWNKEEFVAEFKGENVFFEQLHVHKPDKWENFFDSMRFALFADLSNTYSLRTVPRVQRSKVKQASVDALLRATKLLGRKKTESALAYVNLSLFQDPYYKAVFAKYKPDLVLLCRVFNFSNDYQLLKRAKLEGVPSMLLVSSWDNLTGKGVFPAQPDHLVVWSDMQIAEAMELHGFRRDQVFAAGAPQFDVYADHARLPTREQFFARIGADPNKKLVTLAMGGRVRCPNEFEVVELLHRAIQNGEFREPVQLLARLHPMHVKISGAPKHLKNQPNLFFDTPGREQAAYDRDPTNDDLRHLAATARYSDVVLNMASTTTVDASIFDTPVICVKFDGFYNREYLDSVRRFYDFTHYQKLMAVGQIPIAETIEDLVSGINRYLADPSLERENRARMVKFVCGEVDGHAGERIGRHIVRVAENNALSKVESRVAHAERAERLA